MKTNNLNQELAKNQILISEKEKWVNEIQNQRNDYQQQIEQIKHELLKKMNLLENKTYNYSNNSNEFNHLRNAISDLNTQINFLQSKSENLLKNQNEAMHKIKSYKNEIRIIKEKPINSIQTESYLNERRNQSVTQIEPNISEVQHKVLYSD